jgi:formate hydrogenlyase subunit 4
VKQAALLMLPMLVAVAAVVVSSSSMPWNDIVDWQRVVHTLHAMLADVLIDA